MRDCQLVSVIICNFNYGRYLRDCIDSVLAQTYTDFELIIVDDGSKDDSREIIESYSDDRIIKHFKENGGQASAFNTGVALANGKYIAFLDSDDYWKTDKLAKVFDIFLKFPDLALVQHPMSLIDGASHHQNLNHPNIEFYGYHNFFEEYFLRHHTNFFSVTSGLVIPRCIALKIFPIDTNWTICADVLFTRPLPLYGEVYSIEENLGFYRVHDSNNWMGGENQMYLDENNQSYVDYTNQWLKKSGYKRAISYKRSIVHVRCRRDQFERTDPLWYWYSFILTMRKILVASTASLPRKTFQRREI